MSFAISGRGLHAEIGGHSGPEKSNVVGGAEVARADGAKVKNFLQRLVDFGHQRACFVKSFESDTENAARASVVSQDGVHLRNFSRVILEEQADTDAALFFSRVQNKCDGALGLPAERLQSTGSFEHGHCSRAIVDRALAKIPGVEMAADDDALIGMFAALDFGDGD